MGKDNSMDVWHGALCALHCLHGISYSFLEKESLKQLHWKNIIQVHGGYKPILEMRTAWDYGMLKYFNTEFAKRNEMRYTANSLGSKGATGKLRTMEHCFHMCDRMMIYVFIAASYAPWLNLRELGPLASHMRWFIWLMAAGGTIYVFLYHEKYKIVELFFYLAMGFSPALVVTSMSNTDGLQEVAWGGLIYCLGVVFFKSDGVIPFAHAIWHVFVATAAAVHYYAIWKYLYRSPADIIRHL
nr:monocyte to macrophage differentiation factor isoform X1 [Anser cygnoides]